MENCHKIIMNAIFYCWNFIADNDTQIWKDQRCNKTQIDYWWLKRINLTLDLPGGGGLLVFFTGSPIGPRWSKFWPQKEYVNTCLCFYFDLRPFWGVSDVLVRFYLNFNVSHRGLLEDWKRWFFWNVALKKPQTHFFWG